MLQVARGGHPTSERVPLRSRQWSDATVSSDLENCSTNVHYDKYRTVNGVCKTGVVTVAGRFAGTGSADGASDAEVVADP